MTTLACSALYLLGSDTLTSFFGNRGGELLKLVGAGSRFASVTRGVIDLRDLVYPLSLIGLFLTLNVYTLERRRWAGQSRHPGAPALGAGHGAARGQLPGGQPLAGAADQPARRPHRGQHLLDLGGHPRLPGPAAGAALHPRLLLQPDPPAARPAAAAAARPAARVRGGRPRPGTGGDRRPARAAGAGAGGGREVLHPPGAVPDRLAPPGGGDQLLFRHPRQVRQRIRNARVSGPDRGEKRLGHPPGRGTAQPGTRHHPGDQEGALQLPGRRQPVRRHPGAGAAARLPVGGRASARGARPAQGGVARAARGVQKRGRRQIFLQLRRPGGRGWPAGRPTQPRFRHAADGRRPAALPAVLVPPGHRQRHRDRAGASARGTRPGRGENRHHRGAQALLQGDAQDRGPGHPTERGGARPVGPARAGQHLPAAAALPRAGAPGGAGGPEHRPGRPGGGHPGGGRPG